MSFEFIYLNIYLILSDWFATANYGIWDQWKLKRHFIHHTSESLKNSLTCLSLYFQQLFPIPLFILIVTSPCPPTVVFLYSLRRMSILPSWFQTILSSPSLSPMVISLETHNPLFSHPDNVYLTPSINSSC